MFLRSPMLCMLEYWHCDVVTYVVHIISGGRRGMTRYYGYKIQPLNLEAAGQKSSHSPTAADCGVSGAFCSHLFVELADVVDLSLR